MRRRLGRIQFGEIADSIGRIVVASAFVAGTAYGAWYGLDRAFGRSVAAQVLSVGVALVAATGVYLLASRALKVRELGALLALRSRLQRAVT